MAQGPRGLEELSVGTVTRRWPQAMAVLHRHGIDLCCGGWMTLRRAAGERGIDLGVLLAELAEAGVGQEGEAP